MRIGAMAVGEPEVQVEGHCSYPGCNPAAGADAADNCCKVNCKGLVHYSTCQQGMEQQLDFSADGTVLCYQCLCDAAQVPRTAYEQGLELLQLRKEVRYLSAQNAAILERTADLQHLMRHVMKQVTGHAREYPGAPAEDAPLPNGKAMEPENPAPPESGQALQSLSNDLKGQGSQPADVRHASDDVSLQGPPNPAVPLPQLGPPAPAYLGSVIFTEVAGKGNVSNSQRNWKPAAPRQGEGGAGMSSDDDEEATAAAALGGLMEQAVEEGVRNGSSQKRGLAKWIATAKGVGPAGDADGGRNGELPASKLPVSITGIWQEYERELKPVIQRHGRNAWSFSRLGHHSKAAQNRWDKRRSAITVIETTAAQQGVAPMLVAAELDEEWVAMDNDPRLRPAVLKGKRRVPLQTFIDGVLRPRARSYVQPHKRVAPHHEEKESKRGRRSLRGSSEDLSSSPGLEDAPIGNPSLATNLDGYAFKADAETTVGGLREAEVEPEPAILVNGQGGKDTPHNGTECAPAESGSAVEVV